MRFEIDRVEISVADRIRFRFLQTRKTVIKKLTNSTTSTTSGQTITASTQISTTSNTSGQASNAIIMILC